ncbi:MAG: metallophosphoesterase [Syntrophaceae bacterium]|nr:metallophosphoesterase [Syntrophaceae bacterium]
MFGYILISIVTVLHIYVFWRATSVPFLRRYLHPGLIVGAGVFLWAIFYLGRTVGHGSSGELAWWLELLGLHWMAVVFLLFIPLFVIDIVTGFGFIFPRFAPSLRGISLAAGLVLSVIALIQGLRPPEIHRYDVTIPGLSGDLDGKAIVALSDLHLGSMIGKKWLTARVDQVREENPDIIFLLGDLFEGHGEPMGDILTVMQPLAAPLGVWVVPGNHEFHGGRDANMELITTAGFHLLRDRWVEPVSGLVLAGVDDLTSSKRRGRSVNHIEKALTGRPAGATILLSHSPLKVDEAAKRGVNLMLSAHTHGGQIWPFGYLVRLVYPYMEGRYDVSGMALIVSRGTGTWGPRMRLWRRGEILRITLRS